MIVMDGSNCKESGSFYELTYSKFEGTKGCTLVIYFESSLALIAQ